MNSALTVNHIWDKTLTLCYNMMTFSFTSLTTLESLLSSSPTRSIMNLARLQPQRLRAFASLNLFARPLEGRPPNPHDLLTPEQTTLAIQRLVEWWSDKTAVLCLTGAGMSTEAGIPDYRGHNGSYFKDHKPMVHDQFMSSAQQRQRYWGRGLVGWKSLHETQPTSGHYALAALERMDRLGVDMEDQAEFYEGAESYLHGAAGTSSRRRLALITQNVDGLHRRAGSQNMVELHGRTHQLECMNCGYVKDRLSFHSELELLNQDWLQQKYQSTTTSEDSARPDGDAALNTNDFSGFTVPPCPNCETGFFKPQVVFFGDSVPKHRVALCRAAVDQADGLVVVGSSLTVHSAFRHVRHACQSGVPVAIVNVGPTRAEAEGLDVFKVEAPAGVILSGLAQHFDQQQC